jgi:hypothetical protein
MNQDHGNQKEKANKNPNNELKSANTKLLKMIEG